MVTTTKPAGTGLSQTKLPRNYWQKALIRFRHDWVSLVALVILLTITLLSLGAEFLIQNVLHQNRDGLDFSLLERGLQPPTAPGVGGHFLGTDTLARDQTARVLYGGQVSLQVGYLTAFIAGFIGTTLGLLAGFYRGWLDALINAVAQIIINIPLIFFLIILSFIVRFNAFSLSIFIGAFSWVNVTRIVRGQVLSLRTLPYIQAAQVMGATNRRIMFVHILPNIASIVFVALSFEVVGAMLLESGLSYLGYGVSIPIPSWGNMLSDARLYFYEVPWLIYPPALALFVTITCVYIVANGVRDAFDTSLGEN